MTKVNMSFLSEHRRKMEDVNPLDFLLGKTGDDLMGEVCEIEGYMEDMAGKAKSFVLERIDEEKFVDAVRTIMATLCTSMEMSGADGVDEFSAGGAMETYTHTVVMTILGMLIDEEVL